MPTAKTKTFRSGNSEAVRLPREVAYGREVELTVVRSGDVLTIYPSQPERDELYRRLLEGPGPTTIQARDEVEIPERPGL